MSNISSMTGYANAKVQTDMGLLSIDIRSVNSRFLDLSFRASEEIRFLEPKFREIRQNCSRQDGVPFKSGGFRPICRYGFK